MWSQDYASNEVLHLQIIWVVISWVGLNFCSIIWIHNTCVYWKKKCNGHRGTVAFLVKLPNSFGVAKIILLMSRISLISRLFMVSVMPLLLEWTFIRFFGCCSVWSWLLCYLLFNHCLNSLTSCFISYHSLRMLPLPLCYWFCRFCFWFILLFLLVVCCTLNNELQNRLFLFAFMYVGV